MGRFFALLLSIYCLLELNMLCDCVTLFFALLSCRQVCVCGAGWCCVCLWGWLVYCSIELSTGVCLWGWLVLTFCIHSTICLPQLQKKVFSESVCFINTAFLKWVPQYTHALSLYFSFYFRSFFWFLNTKSVLRNTKSVLRVYFNTLFEFPLILLETTS